MEIKKPIIILGIESSCDETSASICVDGNILSNVIATQEIHAQYGGVIPEVASRMHLQNIIPVITESLMLSNIKLSELSAVAFTQSPGLIGALMVGTQVAKSIAWCNNIPLIAVNHMQAHVVANLLTEPAPSFPFLCLTVSGGHTQIVLCNSPTSQEILGQTIDDAAGEAFDKSAKLLGLPYPGGPLIDQLATNGNGKAFKFAEPNVADLNFSFSGLKTSVLYFLQKQTPDFIEDNKADLCASIQYTIINILLKKLNKAVLQTGIKNVCLAGGVSANKGLRKSILEMGTKYKWKVYMPAFEYCTDNAAMIAITGYYKYLENDFVDLGVSPSAVVLN